MKNKPFKIDYETEIVPIDSLRPHPDNYRGHDAAQVAHIVESIKAVGYYRNTVIAKDGTILAGHGVIEACKQLGVVKVPVVRLNIGPMTIAAKRVLTGDNEISRIAEVDDRKLTMLLKEIHDSNEGLLGTGFDARQLANLVFITRPENEIKDFAAAAEWVGMPEYDEKSEDWGKTLVLEITFQNEKDREQFLETYPIKVKRRIGNRWSTTWPLMENHDKKSIVFEGKTT